MGLKHSPDYIDSKYIWVHVSNFLGQVFFWYTIFVIFSLTRDKEEVWPGGTLPMLLPE